MGVTTGSSAEGAARTRMRREQRGEQLLDVAEALFGERGFEITSMEDIARAAGVTRTVVYAHYATKDAIFLACVERARRDLEERLGELEVMLDGGADLEQVIERGGEIFFEILDRDPQRWAVLFSPSSALSPGLARRVMQLHFRTVDRIVEVARRFAPHIDVDRISAIAHGISGVGEQLGRWWLTRPDLERGQVVGYYRDFIISGLAPRDQPT